MPYVSHGAVRLCTDTAQRLNNKMNIVDFVTDTLKVIIWCYQNNLLNIENKMLSNCLIKKKNYKEGELSIFLGYIFRIQSYWISLFILYAVHSFDHSLLKA